MTYYVYAISIKNIVRYVGYTTDLDRREKEHNKKNKKKQFYDWLKDNSINEFLYLEPIYKCTTKTEAKRYEMYIILHFYFFDRTQLKQKVPSIHW